ncbi:MAG: aminotransferase class I/II-fold pyridoxal phosphate-dependent enzyme, partial [Clostridia bacterium]|nr:aminotransferase class I/II-fold pyridoxal phosphate-dependent enzyme [Clostridia bacterium]
MNYDNILNDTITEIQPSGIRKFFDIAASMDDVISLGVGEPDFETPWKIRNAAIKSLERGKTGYSSNRGLAELRSEISKYLLRKYGLEYNSDKEILVTVGGSEAIDAAIRSVVNPGDEVIVPQPSYVCYVPMIRMAGGIPVIIENKAENDFKLKADELREKISDKTKAIILPYPSNPTGAIMEKQDFEEIESVIKDTEIILISDEIYAELTFNGKGHVSPASVGNLKERTVVINGFSKAFSMTGWRLGYTGGPEPVISQITKLHQFAIMCAPTTSQYAAITALRDCDMDVEHMIEEYDVRRKIMVKGFNDIGLECREPEGAFYTFPSIKSTGLSSGEFCEKLLQSQKVALVPGTAFGESGEGYVRASYCYSTDH